jgi:hypothetical protein
LEKERDRRGRLAGESGLRGSKGSKHHLIRPFLQRFSTGGAERCVVVADSDLALRIGETAIGIETRINLDQPVLAVLVGEHHGDAVFGSGQVVLAIGTALQGLIGPGNEVTEDVRRPSLHGHIL